MKPLVPLLAVAGIGAGAWFLFSGSGVDPIMFTNGFDFPVKAKIVDEGGSESTVEIPAHGRIGADLEGKHTITFSSPEGKMKAVKYNFKDKSELKDECFYVINILGSASLLADEIAYGSSGLGGNYFYSGRDYFKVCPTWGFETEKPPEAVSVSEDTHGVALTWFHYDGEGDWYATIKKLLAQPPNISDQDRIRAWNLAVAVSKHDPKNERLPTLGPDFKAACEKMIDMFKGGPMEGQMPDKCRRNANALFPGG
ncbi:MAG: hypothetical protein ACE366_18545 [Bradymonadia bacterium]